MHYNGYPAAEINGGPSPGHSSGQAQGAMAELLGRTLPNGMTFEWTELAYQDAVSGNTMFLIFPLCVLLVYGVLALTIPESPRCPSPAYTSATPYAVTYWWRDRESNRERTAFASCVRCSVPYR